MEIVSLIGLVTGLVGALTGIGAIIYALDYFEYLGGKKKSSILAISKEKLKQKLLALNSQGISDACIRSRIGCTIMGLKRMERLLLI